MIALRLIEDATAAGLSLEADGPDLVIEAAVDPPPELIEELRRHKAELLALLSRGNAPDPQVADTDDDAGGIGVPTLLRDGRRLHRFRAESVPPRPCHPVQGLMDEARWRRAVLVADGHELIVVEAWSFALDIDTLTKLKLEAGSIIAVLRGESRKRTADAPMEASEPS